MPPTAACELAAEQGSDTFPIHAAVAQCENTETQPYNRFGTKVRQTTKHVGDDGAQPNVTFLMIAGTTMPNDNMGGPLGLEV